ncbi:MAG: hypothetical protein KC503_15095 [Myxococcales bacterium]|nr:hypothetical protein [Myxococcales bacterium]
MTLNSYEEAIVKNAQWFVSMQDADGFINVPADEYYGVAGDASLIGHSMSVRVYAWYLTGDERFRRSAETSAQWLLERQDDRGGWHHDAGYSLDAAQCVMEGLASYQRLTGDRRCHDAMVRAADRMISGTIDPDDGHLLIGNLIECGEYVHHALLAWRLSGLDRHREGALAILEAITSQFDVEQGYWNTVGDIEVPRWMELTRGCLGPVLRCSMSKLGLKGKTIAKISERVLPLALRGRGPQYCLAMMDAEGLLDTLDGAIALPALREQSQRALAWVHAHCRGPVAGSFCESRAVAEKDAVYPLPAINDAHNASLWPTAATLLAYVGLGEHRDEAKATADWIVSMQDDAGGFWTHQNSDGERFGEMYGNVNFYGSTALWYYNWAVVRQRLHPTLFPSAQA